MSKQSLVVEFTKMQAAGNDFIVIDNRFYYFSEAEQTFLSQKWCDRHFGIGGDGLIFLSLSQDDPTAVDMRHYNPDGKEASLCGNGTRCTALYAISAGLAAGPDVRIQSGAGMLTSSVDLSDNSVEKGWIKVKMPNPRGYKQSAIQVGGYDVIVSQIWTGTEHAVYEYAEDVDFNVFASRVRSHRAMGERGANVNEIQILQPGIAKIRTYEKGVEDETLACGTGAVAAAYHMLHHKPALTKVLLHAAGGDLVVTKQEDGWYLEGPAEHVYRGTFEYRGQERAI